MICKLCRENKKLIKAHILPEGFFRRMRKDEAHLFAITGKGGYKKRLPIGEYDQEILCKDCDAKLGVWDNYALKILKKETFEQGGDIMFGEILVGREVGDVIYEKLKLFFVSLLWRASISGRDVYKAIKLGVYEERARQLILDNSPGLDDEFSVNIYRFVNDEYGLLNPSNDRYEGINYINLYIPGYVACVKVDRRRTPQSYVAWKLSRHAPLYIGLRDYIGSPEFRALIGAVSRSR